MEPAPPQANELEDVLESLKSGLDGVRIITSAQKRELAGHLDIMKSQAKALAGSPIAESTFFKIAFAGVGDSAVKAGVAFSNGHGMEGGAEVCRMLSSGAQLLSYFGVVGGPMAVFIGEVLSLISTMLKVVKTEKSSLGKQLRHELVALNLEEGVDLMTGVLAELEQQEGILSALKPNSASFENISTWATISKGDAIKELGKTQASLLRQDRQTYEIWPYLFEAYLLTSQQYLENFTLAFTALRKTDEHGVILPPKDDYAGAQEYIDGMNNVLESIRDRYEFFIREAGPAAVNHGTIWHINQNAPSNQNTQSVMRRNMILTDTEWDNLGGWSTRVSVGPFERIWTVGSNDEVWTGHGKSVNWTKKIPGVIKAQNIFVVRQEAHVARSDVYTIEKGECYRRTWEEELIKDKFSGKYSSSGKGKFIGEILDLNWSSYEGVHYTDVVATETGRVFLIGKTGEKAAFRQFSPDWPQQDPQQPRVGQLFPPESEEPYLFIGLGANKYNIYLLTHRAIWFKPINDFHEWGLPWQKMEGPKFKYERDYQAIFAGDDGSLILSVNKNPYDYAANRVWKTSAFHPRSELFLWDGKSWRTQEEQYGAANRLCTVPCRGWELFEAVKGLVKGLEKPKDGPEGPGGVID